jgi:cytochrome c556
MKHEIVMPVLSASRHTVTGIIPILHWSGRTLQMLKATTAKLAMAGFLALGVGVTLAYAAGPDDKIKARQTQMKANGKAMGELAKIYKEEAPFDAAVVKAQLDAMGAAYEEGAKAGAWDADSAQGTVETWAKPEVWSDAEGYKKAGEAMGAAMGPVGAATDLASFKPAFEQLGAGCKGCHDKFRRPKEN